MQAKKIIIPVVAIGVLTVGILGWTAVTKADTTSSKDTKQTIVDKLASKFKLKKSDVQAVFDETRQERQNQELKDHQAWLKTRLDKAVKDGAITSNQEQKLLTKFQELQKQRQQQLADLQTWFKDNDIDQSKLKPYMGFGGGHDKGKHMGRFRGHGRMMWR